LATKNWLLHHDNAPSHTSFFTGEFFYQKQHDWHAHLIHLTWPPATYLFPRLKGRHFDTIDAMEAESQVVLNSLTENDFQAAFKKWQKRWDMFIGT
jgi:hypothetical protein